MELFLSVLCLQRTDVNHLRCSSSCRRTWYGEPSTSCCGRSVQSCWRYYCNDQQLPTNQNTHMLHWLASCCQWFVCSVVLLQHQAALVCSQANPAKDEYVFYAAEYRAAQQQQQQQGSGDDDTAVESDVGDMQPAEEAEEGSGVADTEVQDAPATELQQVRRMWLSRG
jgi:hypothetical protein